jgi:hypothetical protein
MHNVALPSAKLLPVRLEHPYTMPPTAYTRARALDAIVRADAGPHAALVERGLESADELPHAASIATSASRTAPRTIEATIPLRQLTSPGR